MADLKKVQSMQVEKMNLFQSIQNIRQVSDAIDAVIDSDCDLNKTDEVLASLAPRLDGALEDLKEQVDKRIDFIEFLDLLEAKCKADEEFLNKRKKSVVLLKERIKEQTKNFIQENPELNFAGTMKSLKVQNNGGKTPIEWKVSFQTMKDVIDPNDVAKFPEDMINKVSLFTLNKEKFEALLNTGVELEAAKLLPRGTHLRIR